MKSRSLYTDKPLAPGGRAGRGMEGLGVAGKKNPAAAGCKEEKISYQSFDHSFSSDRSISDEYEKALRKIVRDRVKTR
ncbi:hypothetical protein [Chromobacterium sinusclupearum]|uniref:hypothetical protein n=1 Tax=Chromobacterium sinusclupearum TaxID=2077146 RepID=UPI0011AEEADA|nr:hypothetical protein [Chromobacterium sinusclupearum]